MFSPPTKNVSWSSLTPPPHSYIPPLLFTPSPATAYCLWSPQELRDKVPLSHPHPSWPPWKVYPPISCKSWGKSFYLLSYLSERGQTVQHKKVQWGELQRQYRCNTHSMRGTKRGLNVKTISGESQTVKRDDHTEDVFSPTILKRHLLHCLDRIWSLDL